MRREDVLIAASVLVTHDREREYGSARESLTRVAAVWTALTGQEFTAAQVALMLSGMKLARLAKSPMHFDSAADAAGYVALAAELASEEDPQVNVTIRAADGLPPP